MSRKPKLTPEQASGIRDMHAQGMGAKRIARVAGLARSLVRRILAGGKRKEQQALPGRSPQLALPVEKPRAPGVLPAPGEAGAAFGVCRWCKTGHVAIISAGLCQACIDRECHDYGSRPIFFGRCWRCGMDKPIHLRTVGGDHLEGLCGMHKRQELSSAIAQARAKPREPDRDSRGLWFDEAAAGGRGAWRA